jgi:hypothetical protein
VQELLDGHCREKVARRLVREFMYRELRGDE